MRNYLKLSIAAALMAGVSAPAAASGEKGSGKTPDSWSYELRNGQRVPKTNRVVQADGSWSEDSKQGKCAVTRTGRDGEVRELRKCD